VQSQGSVAPANNILALANGSLALIVFAHGSRVEGANEAVRRVAAQAAERCGFRLWETAFLELAAPDLPAAVESLAARGARRIVVTPYFLTMGMHLTADLPRILKSIVEQNPGVELECAPPLDGHPALVDIVSDRARPFLDS
jgi:sirohydrochlorin ferrochelatase